MGQNIQRRPRNSASGTRSLSHLHTGQGGKVTTNAGREIFTLIGWSAELDRRTAADGRNFSIRHGGTLPVPSVAAVAAYLFQIIASRSGPHSHCGPPEFDH